MLSLEQRLSLVRNELNGMEVKLVSEAISNEEMMAKVKAEAAQAQASESELAEQLRKQTLLKDTSTEGSGELRAMELELRRMQQRMQHYHAERGGLISQLEAAQQDAEREKMRFQDADSRARTLEVRRLRA